MTYSEHPDHHPTSSIRIHRSTSASLFSAILTILTYPTHLNRRYLAIKLDQETFSTYNHTYIPP